MTTFINRTEITSDRSLNDDQRPHHRDGPTNTTSSGGDRSNNIIEVPYHGSCPRCHHLHTSVLVAFPLDPGVHTRFKCEDCNHQMFGLGRTSTQTTLASVESTRKRNSSETPNGTCFNRPTPPPSSRIEPVASSEQSNYLDKLSTISEVNSPAPRSRSTSEIPPQSGPTKRPLDVSTKSYPSPPRPIEGGHSWHSDLLGPPRQTEQHKSGNVKPGYGVKQWARKRLFGRSRLLRIPGLAWINRKSSKETSPEFQTTMRVPIVGHAQTGLDPESTSGVGTSDVPALESRDLSTPAATFQAGEHSISFSELQEAPANRENLPQTPQEVLPRTKEERIKIKRKTETLKRKAMEQPKCECTDGCHCMKSSQRSSFTSNDKRTSPGNVQVPPHSLDHILDPSESSSEGPSFPLPGSLAALEGLGSHLGTERSLSSSAENSSTVAESSRAPSRLSQHTAVDGSTVSVTRRPASLGRSSSMPSVYNRRRGIHYPEMAQRSDLLAQVNRFTREADAQLSSTGTHDGDDLNPSEGTESSHCLQEPSAYHASSTSLANLPDPAQSAVQIPVDGTSGPSQSIHTLAAGGSQEPTPRPLSFYGSEPAPLQPDQAAPDTLSSALQDVLTDENSDEHNALMNHATSISDDNI